MKQERLERQVRLRCRVGGTNLFARLSTKVAQELFQDAREASVPVDGAGWRASDAPPFEVGCASGVGFLPLEITVRDGSRFYASYNGGSIDEEEAIELPDHTIPNYASYQGGSINEEEAMELSDHTSHTEIVGDLVALTALPFIRNASKLTVVPVTTKDWELLELYSGFLESGSLLSQVSVVYPDQVLRLSVGANDYARLRVDPDLEDCHRLVADTEIIVVPKPRRMAPSPSAPLRLVGTTDDWSEAMRQLAVQEQLSLHTVSPGAMVIHPKTLESKIPGWKASDLECRHAIVWRVSDETRRSETRTIVVIKASETIGEGLIALHILNRYSIEASPLVDWVQMQLLPIGTVQRTHQRTNEYLQDDKLNICVEKLNIVFNEDDPWKPWRCIDDHSPPESFDTSRFFPLLQNGSEMLLTEESIFLCPRSTSSVARLCIGKSEDSATVGCSRNPAVIVTVERALKACDSGPSRHVLSLNDQHLTLMPTTSHCPRTFDSTWRQSFLETGDRVDAWMLHGDTGTGKTHYALLFASIARMIWGMPTFYLDCKKLQAGPDLRMNSTLQELTAAFREALDSQPSVLILDDLDQLAANLGNDDNASDSVGQKEANPIAIDQSKLLANHVQSLMDSCRSKVIFTISCRSMNTLAVEIAESLTCHVSVDIEALNSIERTKIVASMLNLDSISGLDLVSSLSEGYRAQDLKIVTTRINHASTDLGDLEETIKSIMNEYVPLSKQGLPAEVTSEDQDWNDVGGIFEAKDKLKTTILDPVKYRRIYEKAPIQLPKGIMLFGPPGCGKSFLVPALAKECGHTLITCRGPELLDRYIGASEANVRQLFERARSAAPSILFLDEFDALAPRRGSDNTGVTDRVVNQLLTYLDGVETTFESVFLIAATSRPDKIDPALLRPGRLEQHIYVGFPHSSAELNDVMLRMMTQRQIASSLLHSFQSNAFALGREEADRLMRLSPADIKAVLDTAHLEAIHEYLASPRKEPVVIQEHHFRKGLLSTRASVSTEDRAMLAQVYRPFLTSSHKSYAKETRAQEPKTSLK